MDGQYFYLRYFNKVVGVVGWRESTLCLAYLFNSCLHIQFSLRLFGSMLTHNGLKGSVFVCLYLLTLDLAQLHPSYSHYLSLAILPNNHNPN